VLIAPALSPLLASVVGAHSFLALLLLSASQEVVRNPPYGASGAAYRPAYRIGDAAYRIGDAAYRSRRRCFVDKDFVLLYTRYRSAGGLRCPTTHSRHCSLGGLQGFFALPEGQAKQPAALPIPQSDEPYQPPADKPAKRACLQTEAVSPVRAERREAPC
jgi:hypothetical protein